MHVYNQYALLTLDFLGPIPTTPEEPAPSLRVATAYHSRNRSFSEKLRTDHSLSPSSSFSQLGKRGNDSLDIGELTERLQTENNIFAQADYLNRIYTTW